MEKVNADRLTEAEFLKQYRPGDYEKPAVTVDMLVFKQTKEGLKLLLIKRKNHPYIGCPAIPGGFVEMDESLDEAAARELKEETNLENIEMKQFHAWGAVDRDPRSRVISISYMAVIPEGGPEPVAGDDAAAADWYTVYYEGNASKMKVTLTCKDEKICFETDDNGKVFYLDEDEKLAFDHGDIVVCALGYLNQCH